MRRPTTRRCQSTRGHGRLAQAWSLLLLLLQPAGAWADDPEGLETGKAHQVVLDTHPTVGLEVGMPRDGWYARGIRLDMEGRWNDSYKAYQSAVNEFQELLHKQPDRERAIRGWLQKALFQRGLSWKLNRQPDSAWSFRFSGTPTGLARDLHLKWLGIRAFCGQQNRTLQERVIGEYQRSLAREPGNDRDRLGLAAFYHEVGQRREGRKLFAAVQPYRKRIYRLEVAHYLLAAGQREEALAELALGTRYSANRSLAQQSNLFDALRPDPRFREATVER